MRLESILIGIAIWLIIFVVWYCKHYPQRLRSFLAAHRFSFHWPKSRKAPRPIVRPGNFDERDYKALVETVEAICARDRIGSADAASLVQTVKRIMEIEPSSGQIWEAYALDSLESAEIVCDECHVPVRKIIKKTGVRIECPRCHKWLALRNSKVTVIDPNRPDIEDWEH